MKEWGVNTKKSRMTLLFCLLVGLGLACAERELSPEEQVRLRIHELEECVRKRELSELKAAVSETYHDSRGQDKKAIEGLLAYWFLQNQQTYVLTRMVSVEVQASGAVHTDFFAVLAGSPVLGFEDLAKLQGDIFRFQIEWVREGEVWNLVEADWHFATQDDLRAFWDEEGAE